jgi:hypothetical protein
MDPLEQARALFKSVGLNLPPIPETLRPDFKKRAEWCFASRPVDISPYLFQNYVKQAQSGRISDYVLLAHAGHGINSYAIHYYLVNGPVRVFLQLAWGGVYTDKQKATGTVNECFELAGRLLTAFEKQEERERMLIAASDFYGSRWLRSGREEANVSDNKPREILKAVLESFATR